MAKKVGGQQLFVARGGNATTAGPPTTFSFATGSARDACAAKFDGRKDGLLVVAIKWTLDAQKRSTVTFCGLTAAKKKLPVGDEPNAASKAAKKTEDAEEQPEEKAEVASSEAPSVNQPDVCQFTGRQVGSCQFSS